MFGEEQQSQRVVVTDVEMPFRSMVRFLVKLALASIPALCLVAMILGGILFAGRALAEGVVEFLSNRADQAVLSKTPAAGGSSEARLYLDNMRVQKVSVGRTTAGGQGVFGEVVNDGGRVVKRVDLIIICIGRAGRTAEREATLGLDGRVMPPGSGREFGVGMAGTAGTCVRAEVVVRSVELEN